MDAFTFETALSLFNCYLWWILSGSLSENEEVKQRLVELGSVLAVVTQMGVGDIEVKRACGYYICTLAEQIEYHNDLAREGALESLVALAKQEDGECQEYAAFSLAHIAANRDYQVPPDICISTYIDTYLM